MWQKYQASSRATKLRSDRSIRLVLEKPGSGVTEVSRLVLEQPGLGVTEVSG